MESVYVFECVDSTNNVLKDLAATGAPDGTVVLSQGQTAGRGRLGRSFFSPANQGIYLSMLFRPTTSPADSTALTAWVSVAVSEAIEAVCRCHPQIKWVNDLLVDGKKIGGILTESSVAEDGSSLDFIIVGVGINVYQRTEDFPSALQSIATSLCEITAASLDLIELSSAIIHRLDVLRDEWPYANNKYYESYCRRCCTLGHAIRFFNGAEPVDGVAISLDSSFGLLVRQKNGDICTLSSGEIFSSSPFSSAFQ